MIEHYSPQNEAIRITQNYIEYASNNSETTTNDETHFYNGMDGSLVQAFAPTGLNSVVNPPTDPTFGTYYHRENIQVQIFVADKLDADVS